MNFCSLNESHSDTDFDCGNEDLNSFLQNFALIFQKRHFGITIVGVSQENTIVGYYTLCPASIQRESLPAKLFKGPQPNPIPAFRLCRLAVSKKYQGQGYGKILLIHALKKCIVQSRQIGGSAILVDAKHNQAKQFYIKFGFVPLSEDSLNLIQRTSYLEEHFNRADAALLSDSKANKCC